jgi:cyclopropane-fatty-acyl-phospholipid synthase
MTGMAKLPDLGGQGVGAWMLRRIVAARLLHGTLTIVTPGGMRVANPGAGPGPHAELVLHNWRALRRLVFGGDLGFAEAYLDGDWDSPDVASFVELAALNLPVVEEHADGTMISRVLSRLQHRFRANTKRGARRNIEAHYDLGNDFYAAWLDPGMTYSSALFSEAGQSLEAAQTAKQDRVLDLLKLQPGARVLEIGCGWGSGWRKPARGLPG